jgi:uncharacterized membrane protein
MDKKRFWQVAGISALVVVVAFYGYTKVWPMISSKLGGAKQ